MMREKGEIMTIQIDKDTAIGLLERAVNEKGADYIYPGANDVCKYADEGPNGYHPGCIVGHALTYLGLDTDALHALDELNDPGVSSAAAVADFDPDEYDDEDVAAARPVPLVLAQDYGIVLDRDAIDAWRTAQSKQDQGYHWGRAVKVAKERVY